MFKFLLEKKLCPGFCEDSVNYHKKPGVNKARPVDPNWPNKQGAQYHVQSCSVWIGGSWKGTN